MNNFLWYKEINYWRIEFVIFISMQESTVEDGTPLEGSRSVQHYHLACYCSLVQPSALKRWQITCCEWVFSQKGLLVLLKDLGIRSWFLWVQSIFRPQKNDCGRVWMEEQTATKPKLHWLALTFCVTPSVISGIPSKWCLGATLGGGGGSWWSQPPHSCVCSPKGTDQAHSLPSARDSREALASELFRSSWRASCQLLFEKLHESSVFFSSQAQPSPASCQGISVP